MIKYLTTLNSLSTDNLTHIFDFINNTKLKINNDMSLDEVLDLIWEVQKIERRQNLYFMELRCRQVLMELKLQKKITNYKIYWSSLMYEYDSYEYMYYI